jgi:DNA-binding NtrC family response regulator
MTGTAPPLLAHTNEARPPAPEENGAAIKLFNAAGDIRPLDDIEAEIIEKALAHYNGHMSEVARRLGIGRSTLYRKIMELGLDSGLDLPRQNRG